MAKLVCYTKLFYTEIINVLLKNIIFVSKKMFSSFYLMRQWQQHFPFINRMVMSLYEETLIISRYTFLHVKPNCDITLKRFTNYFVSFWHECNNSTHFCSNNFQNCCMFSWSKMYVFGFYVFCIQNVCFYNLC